MNVIKKNDQKIERFGNIRISHAFESDGLLFVKTERDAALPVALPYAEQRKFGDLERVLVVETLSYTIARSAE